MSPLDDELNMELVDYADGVLPPEARVRVRKRLAESAEARATLAALEASLAHARAIWQAQEAELAGLRGMNAPRRPWVRRARVGAVAASVALLLGGSLIYGLYARSSHPTSAPPKADLASLEQMIARAGVSAEFLAVADLLAAQPGGEELALARYRFIADEYPETDAAHQSRCRLDNWSQRSSMP